MQVLSLGQEWQPTPVFLPGECLARTEEPGGLYSPWGLKESDTTEATLHACSYSEISPLLEIVVRDRSMVLHLLP